MIQANIWTFIKLVCFRSRKQSCESQMLYVLLFCEEPSSVHISTQNPVSCLAYSFLLLEYIYTTKFIRRIYPL